MKSLMAFFISFFQSISEFFYNLVSAIDSGDNNIDPDDAHDLYHPKSGHHFDIEGLERHSIIAICEALFSLGVAGYGMNYPADAILYKSVAIVLVTDADRKLRIYFFSQETINDAGPGFCNNPQSIKKLHETIDFLYKKSTNYSEDKYL